MKVHLDFETRSEVDLPSHGAWAYFTHASTEVLCVAYAVDDGEVKLITREQLGNPVSLNHLRSLAANPYVTFHAHNAAFEYLAVRHVLNPRFDVPYIPENRWRCTMAKAAAHGLPLSLDDCAMALELPEQKDNAGRTVMLQLSSPRTNNKTGERYWVNDPVKFQTLYAYCKNDVMVERAIDHRLPDLSPSEQIVWECDFRMNMRGIRVDLPAVKAAQEYVETFKESMMQRFATIVGREFGPTQRALCQKWLNQQLEQANLPPIQDTKAGTLDRLLSEALPDHVLEAVGIIKAINQTSVAKLNKMANYADAAGVCRGQFQFHAASTGRWGGRGFQPQNLPHPNAQYPAWMYFAFLLDEV